MTLPLSVLDLSPVASGATARQALQNTLELARHVEAWGYSRFWLAEHHNMPGIASSSPEIMIGQVARETTRIRVGSGGVMLPNHAPLKVAESFKTLEALYPERIDLGIGRAPGTDPRTALALRGSREALGAENFDQQLGALMRFGGEGFPPGHPLYGIQAVPTDVPLPPIYLLGSSDYSARLAARLGQGFAFAYHFSPHAVMPAMRLYREGFRPSAGLKQPHAILTVSVICADTDEEAERLSSSLTLAFLRLMQGQPGKLPSPEEALEYPYSPLERERAQGYRAMQVIGTPERVRERLELLARQTQADELMISTSTHSFAARLRSYELLAKAFAQAATPLAQRA